MKVSTFFLIASLLLSATASAQNYIVFNGGISQEERATAPNTGTRLVFFVRAGNFLANVSVSVKDSAGQELVNTVTTGPWLILNLPNGRYSVNATIPSGEAQGLSIEVDGSNKEFGFMFSSVE
jgi:hypothetical protein